MPNVRYISAAVLFIFGLSGSLLSQGSINMEFVRAISQLRELDYDSTFVSALRDANSAMKTVVEIQGTAAQAAQGDGSLDPQYGELLTIQLAQARFYYDVARTRLGSLFESGYKPELSTHVEANLEQYSVAPSNLVQDMLFRCDEILVLIDSFLGGNLPEGGEPVDFEQIGTKAHELSLIVLVSMNLGNPPR